MTIVPKFNKKTYQLLFSWLITPEDERMSFEDLVTDLKLSAEEAKMYLFILTNRDKLDLHTDVELANAFSKSRAETQRYMDKNRILRKDLRESSRIPNALEELNKSMINLLKKNQIKHNLDVPDGFNLSNSLQAGIVQCSDWHLNEKVNEPGLNTFDYNRASKMLKKLGNYATFKFRSFGVNHQLLLLQHDLYQRI